MMITLPPKPAAQVCASLQSSIQALVKIPLKIKSADDATTDDTHHGEAGYYACVFAAASGEQMTVILSGEKEFTDAAQKGYKPLPGFGDRARVALGGIHFVDVMKGKNFCEAIVVLDDTQLNAPNWATAGGQACTAALAPR